MTVPFSPALSAFEHACHVMCSVGQQLVAVSPAAAWALFEDAVLPKLVARLAAMGNRLFSRWTHEVVNAAKEDYWSAVEGLVDGRYVTARSACHRLENEEFEEPHDPVVCSVCRSCGAE